MEKLRKSYQVILPPVEMFLDDLRRLTQILDKLTSEWHLETKEYKFNDVNDLMNNTRENTISSLTVRTAYPIVKPLIVVNIHPQYVYTAIEEDNENDWAVEWTFKDLKQFLLSKKRKVPFLARWAVVISIGSSFYIVGLTFLLLVILRVPRPDVDLINTSFGALLISVSLLTSMSLLLRRDNQDRSVIHMTSRSEPLTVRQRVDEWIDMKGQVRDLVGHALRGLLYAGAGAASLYLYQHWHEWF